MHHRDARLNHTLTAIQKDYQINEWNPKDWCAGNLFGEMAKQAMTICIKDDDDDRGGADDLDLDGSNDPDGLAFRLIGMQLESRTTSLLKV